MDLTFFMKSFDCYLYNDKFIYNSLRGKMISSC